MLFREKILVEKVDVVIPTYKPDQKFLELIDRLEHQTVPIHQIIIMNTEQKYFDRLFYGTSFLEKYKNITVKHLSKREFDHGRTRNQGVKKSEADIFVMMTDDAMPADEYMIEELLKGLKQKNVAVSYGRQLAYETSNEVEKFTRDFNSPSQARIKTKKDLNTLGIKTFFCSNVCAAYKRDIFDALGGFIKHTIFNEDMIFAAGAIQADYGIAYVPEAKVYHSHHYTNMEQFRRNFDLGVSQVEHPEVFEGVPSESEGIKLVKKTITHLREKKKGSMIPGVIIQSGFKYLGYICGKNYRRLPRKMVVKCSMNKEYWS